MVFLSEDVGESPVAEAVDVSELAFAVEDFHRPLARHAEVAGEATEKLNDLRDMVVILAVLGT